MSWTELARQGTLKLLSKVRLDKVYFSCNDLLIFSFQSSLVQMPFYLFSPIENESNVNSVTYAFLLDVVSMTRDFLE
jgi:hypothetical protein